MSSSSVISESASTDPRGDGVGGGGGAAAAAGAASSGRAAPSAAPTAAPSAARRALHGPLAAFSAAMGLLTLATLIGLAADDRLLAGAPIWLKPLHFAFSLAVYGATLAWLIPRIRRFPRTAWWAGTMIALSSLAEAVIISVQAWRGTYSHFNQTTPVDTVYMNSMTVAVIVLWTSNLVAAVLVARDGSHSRPLRWAIRLGLALAVVGMALGMLMNPPTPEQQRALDAGLPTLVGAHNVGVADGGAGMPLTNWSTEGGDLRIPHFLGIHALQVLPAAALLLGAAGRRRRGARGPGEADSAGRGSAGRGSMARGSVEQGLVERGSAGRGSAAQGSVARGSVERGSAAHGSAAHGSVARGSVARSSSAPGSAEQGSVARSDVAAEKSVPRLADEAVATRLVIVLGSVWAGLMAVVTWQALRGQALVHPDAATLAATGLILGAGAVAAATSLRTRR
ncbi:hypothetical protein [Streptomyces avidinii]